MRRTLLAVTLVAAACGGAAEAEQTIGTAAPAGTEAPATTSTAPTVATTQPSPSTTTTAAAQQSDVAAGGTLGQTLLSQPPEVDETSGRFEAILELSPAPNSGILEPVVITIAGAFASNGDTEIAMDFGDLFAATGEMEDLPPELAELFAEPMQVRTVGSFAYLKGGIFSMFIETDKWIQTDADDATLESSGFDYGADGDPTDLLDSLEDANADITEIGPETVKGVATTHYRAIIDLAAFADELSDDERSELEAEFGDLTLTELPVDIWIGDDGAVYRFAMELGPETIGENAEEFSGMRMEFTMWDYGADVVIEPPPEDEIATDDELGFGFGDA